MSTSYPLVSIIMPAYQAARYIGEAIESVLAQTYPHWELIIIDDASRDNTEDIVANYSDPRIIYRKVERIGHPAGVRNTGIRMAKGEFVGFLDADDVYLPDCLKILTAPLLENPRNKASFGFDQRITEDGAITRNFFKLVPREDGGYDLPPHYRHCWEEIVQGRSVFM